jgi:TorA maturation chaperone TorD
MSRPEPSAAAQSRLTAARAVAGAFARLWLEPDAATLRRWRSDKVRADIAAVCELLACDPESLMAVADAAHAPLRALREEYERLFVGPGSVPCPPYEALWRSDRPKFEEGTLLGAATQAVVELYQEIGVRVRDDAHELPDHLAAEWEAVAYGLAGTPPQRRAAQALVGEHLALWVPPFGQGVAAHARLPLYRELARATAALVPAVAEAAAAAA